MVRASPARCRDRFGEGAIEARRPIEAGCVCARIEAGCDQAAEASGGESHSNRFRIHAGIRFRKAALSPMARAVKTRFGSQVARPAPSQASRAAISVTVARA